MVADQLRFGVLGCADIAERRMLPALAADPAVRVTAVASRHAGRAAEVAGRFGAEPVHGYDQVLDRDDVDAVYIPLPCGLHAEWIERCLIAGKHVLAEKPVSTDTERTAGLVKLANDRGLLLMENAMFLHHSQHAAVRSLVGDGSIGKLRSFASCFAIPGKPADDIRYQAALGGGALLDVGFYPVRAALHYLGTNATVAGAVLRYDTAAGVEVSGSALLTTPTGVTAHLTFGMEHSYRTRYELWGSAGRIALDRAFTPPDTYRPTLRLYQQDRREERDLPADRQFGNVVTAFRAAVAGGMTGTPDADVVIGTASTLDSIRERAVRVAF